MRRFMRNGRYYGIYNVWCKYTLFAAYKPKKSGTKALFLMLNVECWTGRPEGQPKRIENLIPIATDWKTTDKIIANVLIQDQILNNSEDPILEARYFANLYFRNTEYINQIFKRTNLEISSISPIEKCVLANNKCQISGYRLMNFLLKSNDLTRKRRDFSSIVNTIKANIHLIGIHTDGLFPADENRITFLKLRKIKPNVFYHEIDSDFGHDAYLKETERISYLLKPIFKSKKIIIRNKFNYTMGNYFMNT